MQLRHISTVPTIRVPEAVKITGCERSAGGTAWTSHARNRAVQYLQSDLTRIGQIRRHLKPEFLVIHRHLQLLFRKTRGATGDVRETALRVGETVHQRLWRLLT